MGIQGLLPILKPIQQQRHLSELAGQTLAVDAYVWLHRGAFACAAEVAMGKPTSKYVDFCMRHVRLLRYHNISPFLVFDGGPLPAKQGTEKEREARRKDNLEKAVILTERGKHSEAREYYVKCVDITPQMAYQVIKALKAEEVPYIVAPYEADAQLAYLERAGFVDGIITEDSDLLVFGCKNVHFKFDAKEATVTSISRSDFGSPLLAADSMSFVGWSDDQFRWMAMLSGCDYLPSIAGVGLKTAWTLIKKYKTVDKVVRAVLMEGKKDVPKGYLQSFNLAEKVFLHQRVYDPGLEGLVYLTGPSESSLCEDGELYIGRDIDPVIAKNIAVGDVCPISLRPMDDINPGFIPSQHKSLPLTKDTKNSPSPRRRKSLSCTPAKRGGLLNFFTPVAKSPAKLDSPDSPIRMIVAGKASGKRKLADLVAIDAAERKEVQARNVQSRFFQSEPNNQAPLIGHRYNVEGKENKPILVEDSDDDVDEIVQQEDAYISPSPSISRAVTPDFPSPHRAHAAGSQDRFEDSVDNLSSPILQRQVEGSDNRREGSREVSPSPARVLIEGTPEPASRSQRDLPGPDFALLFDDDDVEYTSNNAEWDNNVVVPATQYPSPCDIPAAAHSQGEDIDETWDDEPTQSGNGEALAKVLKGWREKYAFDRNTPVKPVTANLVRSESAKTLPASSNKIRIVSETRLKSRRSEPYPTTRVDSPLINKHVRSNEVIDVDAEDVFSAATKRLDMFRYKG